MEDSIDSLRQHIASCVGPGGISSADMDAIKIRAQRLGISPGLLDAMVREATGADMDGGGFRARWYHVVMAVVLIVILSMVVFINIDFSSDGGRVERVSPSAMRNMPIAPDDLVHIYSGCCDGMSVLITVKSVREQPGGGVDMVYDIKCDFVPLASGAVCHVDMESRTLDFGHPDGESPKIDLGKCVVERTSAGKLAIKSADGKFELMQL